VPVVSWQRDENQAGGDQFPECDEGLFRPDFGQESSLTTDNWHWQLPHSLNCLCVCALA
jgi:hypothetical protein